MANSPQGRKTFIDNVVSFMKTYKFDGFDLDWEYPEIYDRMAYSQLLSEMRIRFDQERWLLSAAVGALRTSSYEISSLNRYLDFINVMSYDLHGTWNQVTGQNAPLYASSTEMREGNSQLNVDAVMRTWIASGANPQKLIMGLAFYGRSFTLDSPNTAIGALATTGGAAGPHTQEPGILGYMEICEKILYNGWTEIWDDVQKNPYAFSGNQWVGYDSVRSLTLKVQRAKALNLGGVMIWSINTDDSQNVCGQGSFPLLRALNQEIATGGAPPRAGPTTTTRVTTTTMTITTTIGSTQVCNLYGFMRDPTNCSRFYRCDPS
jgi:chitinase